MNFSRLLTAAALTATAACGTAIDPQPVAASLPQTNSLLQQALPNAAGKTFTSQIVDFAPGAAAGPHRHGQAFVYAYVLEGAVQSKVDDQPATIYQTGEHWSELPGAHHAIAENASPKSPAKLLVIYISTTGDPLQSNDPH